MDLFREIFLPLLLIFSLKIGTFSAANDIIDTSRSIKGEETLVSSRGMFELGFFTIGNSTDWYLGIWYKNITVRTYVWVANRQVPLRHNTGVLRVTQPGIVALLNDTNGVTIWSSNTSTSVRNPIAQLLDTGNLIIKDVDDHNPENILWQSFDYPTDTYLPGMSFGWNYVTGVETYLTYWRSSDHPGPGEFTAHLDPTGYPQIVIKRGHATRYRFGPWNGAQWSGAAENSNDRIYRLTLVMNKNEVKYREDIVEPSLVSKITLNPNGVSPRSTWNYRTLTWNVYSNIPVDSCDSYNMCGAYGSCTVGNSPPCGCLDKFVPEDEGGWSRTDWSSGCVRRTPLNCREDVFLKYSGIKLPDSRNSMANDRIMELSECEVECKRNCWCVAYTKLNISGKGGGCLFYRGGLVDIRSLAVGGQDLFIRMAAAERDSEGKKRVILIASLTSVVGMVLICLSHILVCTRKRRKNLRKRKEGPFSGSHGEEPELPFFNLSRILKATDNFSIVNKLDQTKSVLLDWQKRYNIINGIAKGLLYLHQDSRLRIIHRDIKASNILLDADMNPKISDFGLARSFGGNETEVRTHRVVGTYGYMSPEYAIDGLFSIKSDLFSFGVLVLEVVSGKRNRGFSLKDHNLNLLGHAWTLYKEGNSCELLDASLGDSFDLSEVMRAIHVGLLCVQKCPEDRPRMSSVVFMLGNEVELPPAKQPGFFTERDVFSVQSSSKTNSQNQLTITLPEGR